MKPWLAWACVACITGIATHAHAQVHKHTMGPSDAYLRAEVSIWSGAHLYKDGEEVGPGFAATDLQLAVRGVPVAELHAQRTKVAAITSIAFATLSIGLTAASLAYHLEHVNHANSWPLLGYGDPVHFGINISWLTSLACGIIARRIYHNELLATVSEYNLVLMRSVEAQFE